jgi:hypothetical protein
MQILWESASRFPFLTFHLVIFRLVAPLKFIYFSIQVSDVLVLTVRCKLINFVFQMFPLFIPEISAGFASYINHVILIYFGWIL